ncbi:MAG TPA: hypothetical protein VHC72_05115, partial [Bryobacteraceae bacterium]|nr:hypothetical protein [Bryobacteraceae bacterium]
LTAEETLDQRGRRGSVEILRGKKDRIKSLDFRLPGDFRTHHVVSRYALDNTGKGRVLHEIRTIVTMDGRPGTGSGEARHAMTIGLRSDDDRTKRRLLEDLDREGLEGAVTDFGQLVLLFTGRLQRDYEFTPGADREVEGEPVTVLRYRQLSGNQGLTFFKDRTEEREKAAGEIWLRQKDLLPLRITMRTTEQLSKKFTISTEAAVDYGSSPFGLVPERVSHQQFLNSDLMMENDLHYAGFHNDRVPIP